MCRLEAAAASAPHVQQGRNCCVSWAWTIPKGGIDVVPLLKADNGWGARCIIRGVQCCPSSAVQVDKVKDFQSFDSDSKVQLHTNQRCWSQLEMFSQVSVQKIGHWKLQVVVSAKHRGFGTQVNHAPSVQVLNQAISRGQLRCLANSVNPVNKVAKHAAHERGCIPCWRRPIDPMMQLHSL